MRSACLKRRQVHLLFEGVKFRPFYVSLSQAITFRILIHLSLALHIFQIGRAIRNAGYLECALARIAVVSSAYSDNLTVLLFCIFMSSISLEFLIF